MSENSFNAYAAKLERNVYGSLKGRIRLQLLFRDILDFCPAFSSGPLSILDVGGGRGQFAALCADLGHHVLLCEPSEDMLRGAEMDLQDRIEKGRVELLQEDFLIGNSLKGRLFDLVLVHGSAEWMSDTAAAICKGIDLTTPGGFLSLLIFNRDKHAFKLGINGLLLRGASSKKKKLIPPGAMSVESVEALLRENRADILLQSGIRVFHGFFRQIDQQVISEDEWLEQERQFYRKRPYSLMGEHSHFVCRVGDYGEAA